MSKAHENSILIIITGASKGLGKEICINGTLLLKATNFHFIFIGRNEEAIQNTGNFILNNCHTKSVTFETHLLDLCEVDLSFEKKIEKIFGGIQFSAFDSIYCFLNAGVCTPMKYVHNNKLTNITKNINVNLTSFCVMTSIFMNKIMHRISLSILSPSSLPLTLIRKIRIIQISSICAYTPMSSASLYCCTKSARNMYFKCFAEELKKFVEEEKLNNFNIKCLSWSPGLMKTDMYKEFCEAEDERIKQNLNSPNMFSITTSDSAQRLWEVLIKDKYNSGDVLDVMDTFND